jgi:hypothetical protein
MNKIYNDDQNLVKFVKQNRPLPPSNNHFVETQLMNIISKENQHSSRLNHSLFWVVPSAIATGLLLMSGSVIKNNLSPQIAHESENLETFMVNSWQGSLSESIDNQQFYNPEKGWFLLTEDNLSSSHP